MLNILKKAFEVPYDEMDTYPTREKAKEAIAKYCEGGKEPYTFTGEDEVEISGRKYAICREVSPLNAGYGIWCREK